MSHLFDMENLSISKSECKKFGKSEAITEGLKSYFKAFFLSKILNLYLLNLNVIFGKDCKFHFFLSFIIY